MLRWLKSVEIKFYNKSRMGELEVAYTCLAPEVVLTKAGFTNDMQRRGEEERTLLVGKGRQAILPGTPLRPNASSKIHQQLQEEGQ